MRRLARRVCCAAAMAAAIGLCAAGCESTPKQNPAAPAAPTAADTFHQDLIKRLRADGYRLNFSVVAKVEKVATIATYSAGEGAVLIDRGRSRWIVVVDQVETLEGEPPTREDGTIAFAVHSPTRLFALSGTLKKWEGQRFRFTLMEKPAEEGLLGHRELVVRWVAD